MKQGVSLGIALSVLVPSSVYGQTPPAPAAGQVVQGEAETRIADAQRHLGAAMAAYRAGDWRAAIREFELTYGLAPQPELWFNIARARAQLGEYELAVEGYRRYLRDKVDPPDRTEVEQAIRTLEQLAAHARMRRAGEAAPTTIQFDVPTRGARLYLDDRLVATAPTGELVTTTPGDHAVRVEADGMRDWRAAVRVRQGAPSRVFALLEPETRFRTIGRPHIASGIVGGLSAASLVASAVFGVQALSNNCNVCSERDGQATRSDVFLGVGAGLAVGAVIVYFIERGSSRTERVSASP